MRQCSGIHRLLIIVLLSLSVVSTPAYSWMDPGYVPLRQNLPNGIDMLESGLYWLQDFSAVEDARDPASLVSLMEDQLARFFDLSYMSYLAAGPAYTRLDILERSHFQNRLRDQLFAMLAKRVGLYGNRLPRLRPLMPVRNGRYGWAIGGLIMYPGEPSIRLLFQFYLSPRGWRIYDVTSNGYSLLSELRRRYYKP